MWRNTPRSYGRLAKVLHWVVAVPILGLIGLGWWMTGLDYYHPWYNTAPAIHKAAGLVVLVLAAARFGWSLANPRPAFAATLGEAERTAAWIAHRFLLLLTLVMPVTGYLVSTSAGAGVDLFGLFTVPALFKVPEGLRDTAIRAHFWLAYGGLGVIALHTAGALKHHFVDRDETLRRMF